MAKKWIKKGEQDAKKSDAPAAKEKKSFPKETPSAKKMRSKMYGSKE